MGFHFSKPPPEVGLGVLPTAMVPRRQPLGPCPRCGRFGGRMFYCDGGREESCINCGCHLYWGQTPRLLLTPDSLAIEPIATPRERKSFRVGLAREFGVKLSDLRKEVEEAEKAQQQEMVVAHPHHRLSKQKGVWMSL